MLMFYLPMIIFEAMLELTRRTAANSDLIDEDAFGQSSYSFERLALRACPAPVSLRGSRRN
jgi:hypothetical protein